MQTRIYPGDILFIFSSAPDSARIFLNNSLGANSNISYFGSWLNVELAAEDWLSTN